VSDGISGVTTRRTSEEARQKEITLLDMPAEVSNRRKSYPLRVAQDDYIF